MNASFFPEQLKHCMCDCLSGESRVALYFCSAARPWEALHGELVPTSGEKIGAEAASSK